MNELTALDIAQIKLLGISEKELARQASKLKDNTKLVKLSSAATINHGILILDDKQIGFYQKYFAKRSIKTSISRFVPASGAASRMFKSFYQYLENGIENEEIKAFAQGYNDFAFYNSIKCMNEPDYFCAINNMIKVLKLAELPKALIPFHSYKTGPRTALEEQMVECALIMGQGKTINIHFTISQVHDAKIKELIKEKLAKLKEELKCNFNLTFSYQDHSTDTIALTSNNQIFRDNSGKIIFRPGGHGALLFNLNKLAADLIYIKNIDNVQPDHAKASTVFYKQVLGGYLLTLQEKISSYLQKMDDENIELDQVDHFIHTELFIKIPEGYSSMSFASKKQFLHSKLNRPLRVCGMVKNEGEPGGGPFWIINKKNEVSLQIVEASQIDLNDQYQAEILKSATHFNPVDLVCWVKDYRGNKFDLAKFSDPGTAFITEKSQDRETLKVLEHPGLWNGAMEDWITIFVEVPVATFSPVKTITDLLRPQHQPK